MAVLVGMAILVGTDALTVIFVWRSVLVLEYLCCVTITSI